MTVVVSRVTRNCHLLSGEVKVSWVSRHVDAKKWRKGFGLLVNNFFSLLLFNDAVHVRSMISVEHMFLKAKFHRQFEHGDTILTTVIVVVFFLRR